VEVKDEVVGIHSGVMSGDGGQVEVIVIQGLRPKDGVAVGVVEVRAHKSIAMATLWRRGLTGDIADLKVITVFENDSGQK
jgi:hypothetical protein